MLAIVFPAVGTALSAIITFYGPQAEWSQSSHTLTSLTQLHSQIAVDIRKLKCAEEKGVFIEANVKDIESKLDEWGKRYVDIITVSSAAGQSAKATESGKAH